MLEITNLTRHKIYGRELIEVAQKVLKIVGSENLKEISLVFVDEKKIQEINKKYRRKNKPTDVLSFEGLNEVFICPQVVAKQARELGVSFESELMRVLVHGILHLIGHDHEKSAKEAEKMRKIEEKILRQD
ncbi:MAG: rRNA maturation RNase YbeY [Candidatus Portnoybacteria bacterium]|nr:rRNA maturation RNase YbeY [Candidatus Portnoybacteria bacterium]